MVRVLYIVFLFFYTLSYGQVKDYFHFDTTYFEQVHLLNAKELVYDSIQSDYFVFGDFIATDDTGKSLIPFYTAKLPKNLPATDLFFFMDQSPILTSRSMYYDYVSDSSGNYFFAMGSNGKKALLKVTDALKSADWATETGHHQMSGITLYQNQLYAVGQDENTNGDHVSMVCVYDLNGNFIQAQNYTFDGGYDNPVSIIHTDSSDIYVLSQSLTNNGFGIFLMTVNKDLKYQNGIAVDLNDQNIYIKHAFFHKEALWMYGVAGAANDSSFIIKSDSSHFNYNFGYKIGATDAGIQINRLKPDSEGNIYAVGTLTIDKVKSPVAFKLDSNFNIVWAHDYNGALNANETLDDIIFFENGDSLMLLGNSREIDTLTPKDPKFFVIKTDTKTGYLECSEDIDFTIIKDSVKTTPHVYVEYGYLGTNNTYQFKENNNFMVKSSTCTKKKTIVNPPGYIPERNNLDIATIITQRKIFLESTSNLPVRVRLFNMVGSELKHLSFIGNASISTAEFSVGVYILQALEPQTGKLYMKKFIISH